MSASLATQLVPSIDKLAWTYSVVMISLYTVTLVLFCFYDISRASHAAALRSLAERRATRAP